MRLSPSPVVARVMAGTVALHDDPEVWLRREVAVLQHLAPFGLAVAPSSLIAPGPYLADGLWMTFAAWVEIEGRTEADDAETLGLALRSLHEALASFDGELGDMRDLQADIERLACSCDRPRASTQRRSIPSASASPRSPIPSSPPPSRPSRSTATPRSPTCCERRPACSGTTSRTSSAARSSGTWRDT